MTSPAAAPLAGIKVVEFGNLVAAPYCGMLLADLGAEVVKVEPLGGDLAREIGPWVGGESAFFMSVNRGKQSLAADPKHPRVAELLMALCLQADVIVNNLRPGAMERMGLGYSDLSALHPPLVYAVISAFGPDGPDAERAGIDLIFQGESGMMSITGEGDPPGKTATTIADFVAGTNTALAIAAALVERAQTGQGRRVDVSLRDGLIAVQAGWNALFFASGRQPERTGTASPVTGPNQTFPTADGYINLAIVSDRHFRKLCELLDRPDLAGDPAFASNETRVANRDLLGAELISALSTQTTAAWLARLEAAGLPAGRILTLPEVFSDPQVLHNKMVVEMAHPTAGTIRLQGSPLRLDLEPALADRPPPLLGEHTRRVLLSMGVKEEEIERLAAAGAVVVS